MWDHLIGHLADAGCQQEAEALACDLRWAGARLVRFGPAAPAGDLAAAGTPQSARLRMALTRMAHLLAPTEPPGSVIDILHSHIADDPDWGPQAAALRDCYPRPRLVSRWPLPDLANPALRRVLTGHGDQVTAVETAPDGSWIATASKDGTVRIWDTATWQQRAVLTGHDEGPLMATAPDGSWLATTSRDETVRIWDTVTGQKLAVLACHRSTVRAKRVLYTIAGEKDAIPRLYAGVSTVAVASDGSWLATACERDWRVRIWDTATWQQRATISDTNGSPSYPPTGVPGVAAAAQDGTWVATTSGDETVRIWDTATWQQHSTHTGHRGRVSAAQMAPDDSWLATGDRYGSVRVWDTATWREQATLITSQSHAGRDFEQVTVRIPPDGSWLAIACGRDQAVGIWDTASWQQRAVLTGHRRRVFEMAVSPDGSWLATASGRDRGVRIWDSATWQQRAALTSHFPCWGFRPLHVASDASWLATWDLDGSARIWDTATWRQRATLASHGERGLGLYAAAPDGSRLATSDADGSVRVWDARTGQMQAQMRLDEDIRSLEWIGPGAIALHGSAGLYIFDLLTTR